MSIPFSYDGQCNFITPKVLHCVTSFPIDLRQYPTTRVNRSRGDWVRLKHFLPKNSYLRFYCEFLRESRINHKLDISATLEKNELFSLKNRKVIDERARGPFLFQPYHTWVQLKQGGGKVETCNFFSLFWV